MLLLLTTVAQLAVAADLEDGLGGLLSRSFDDKAAAVDRLTTSGDPRAKPLLM